MEHYYDEPTHVRSYKKNIYRTDSMGLLNHVEILRNSTINIDYRYRNTKFILIRIQKQNHFFLLKLTQTIILLYKRRQDNFQKYPNIHLYRILAAN